MTILDFIEVKDDGGGSDSWRYKTCKSLVKSNHHPTFYRPVALSVTNKHFQSTEGKQHAQ